MSIPTTSLLPTVFWTGSEAARNHPAYLEVPDRIERSIAELQSAAFAAWLRNLMVRKVRFELTRPVGHQGLSLTRLPFRHMRRWVQGWDSNPHITAYEAGVLPVDYPAV